MYEDNIATRDKGFKIAIEDYTDKETVSERKAHTFFLDEYWGKYKHQLLYVLHH